MAAKDFFKELDPLIEWREEEMSLMEKVRTDSWERKGKEPPHGSLGSSEGRNDDALLMYQMIETLRKENAELRDEMRENNRCRMQEMDLLMTKLTALTVAQEDKKPPPELSSSLGSPDPAPSGDKNLSRSDQTGYGKERSSENKIGELTTDSQSQIKCKTKERSIRPPVLIKPSTYDGTSSWLDYKSHFEACASLGHWSDEEKAMYLAVSLRGQAQSVLGDLAGGVPKKYGELITALNERFSPPNQMELHRAQLRERKQRATDSLPELGQSVRRLTNLAYPTAPYDVKETLAKEYFIDALISSDMRLRIKQSKPATLNDAIRQVVELEAFVKVEEQNKELKGFLRPVDATETEQSKKDFQKLMSRLQDLQEEINDLKSQRRSQTAPRTETRQSNSKNEL